MKFLRGGSDSPRSVRNGFSKYSPSACYVPGTVLGTREKAVNKTDKIHPLIEFTF